MNTETPLLPEAFLAALREIPVTQPADLALKQRVQARLALSLVGLAPAVTQPAVTASSDVAASQFDAMTKVLRGSLGSAKGVIAACLAPVFLAGSLAGVAADRWCSRSHASRVVTSRSRPEALPALQSAEATERHLEPSSSALSAPGIQPAARLGITASEAQSTVNTINPAPKAVVATPPSAPATSSAEPSNSMAAERQLLDSARTALARGEPQAGIASLEKHIKRFPKGTLTEEREALYVRILAACSKDNAAAARAASFERRFPNSIFSPVVKRAASSISRQKTSDATKP